MACSIGGLHQARIRLVSAASSVSPLICSDYDLDRHESRIRGTQYLGIPLPLWGSCPITARATRERAIKSPIFANQPMMPAQRLYCVTCATSTPTPTSTINNILVRFNTTEKTPQHHSPQIRSEYHLTNTLEFHKEAENDASLCTSPSSPRGALQKARLSQPNNNTPLSFSLTVAELS
ncbi:hypothetical protein CI102_2632 [Trichoderma harzianum]|nr:hypothetical protein CI102_2632 [Trichoderma harzianum]